MAWQPCWCQFLLRFFCWKGTNMAVAHIIASQEYDNRAGPPKWNSTCADPRSRLAELGNFHWLDWLALSGSECYCKSAWYRSNLIPPKIGLMPITYITDVQICNEVYTYISEDLLETGELLWTGTLVRGLVDHLRRDSTLEMHITGEACKSLRLVNIF